MKKIVSVMGSIAAVTAAGIIGYTMFNKKTRKKAAALADTMIDEAKSMLNK